MDHEGAGLLDRFVEAWRSSEPEAVADLFSADVTYRYHPYDAPGGPVVKVYENCFVVRFDALGRCRDFTEYYIQHP